MTELDVFALMDILQMHSANVLQSHHQSSTNALKVWNGLELLLDADAKLITIWRPVFVNQTQSAPSNLSGIKPNLDANVLSSMKT